MNGVFSRSVARVFNAQNWLIWILSSAVAGYMGPFGTFDLMGTGERIFFWAVIVGWGLFIVAIQMAVDEEYFPQNSFRASEFWRLALMPPIIVGSLYPCAEWYLAPVPVPITLLQGIAACYLLGGIISVARIAIYFGIEAPSVEVAPLGPRLLTRLPEGDSGPVLRIAAKDHFVEVVTERGAHRIRMRMADAVAEMDGAEGMLVHRSHWVARRAIEGVKRAGAKHYVISADAELIPVSKANLPKLEEAGLAR